MKFKSKLNFEKPKQMISLAQFVKSSIQTGRHTILNSSPDITSDLHNQNRGQQLCLVSLLQLSIILTQSAGNKAHIRADESSSTKQQLAFILGKTTTKHTTPWTEQHAHGIQ